MLHYFIVIGARRKRCFKLRANESSKALACSESSSAYQVNNFPSPKWTFFVITRQTRGRSFNVIYILRMSSLRLDSINLLFAMGKRSVGLWSAPCDKKMENNSTKFTSLVGGGKANNEVSVSSFYLIKRRKFSIAPKADLFQSLSRLVRRSTASTHWDWFCIKFLSPSTSEMHFSNAFLESDSEMESGRWGSSSTSSSASAFVGETISIYIGSTPRPIKPLFRIPEGIFSISEFKQSFQSTFFPHHSHPRHEIYYSFPSFARNAHT